MRHAATIFVIGLLLSQSGCRGTKSRFAARPNRAPVGDAATTAPKLDEGIQTAAYELPAPDDNDAVSMPPLRVTSPQPATPESRFTPSLFGPRPPDNCNT